MRQFKTADLCDDNQDKKIQVLEAKFNNYGGKKRFKGRVNTIKLDKSNWGLIDLLKNKNGENIVLVVDVEQAFYGVVGDKLSLMAEKAKFEAMIINGYVRDTMETKKFKIGLYALGTCPLRNFEKTKSELSCDLHFGGVSFKEDDYIYADEDGIIISKEKLH